MGYYGLWPLLIIFAILLAYVSTPLFRAADTPPIPAGARVETLDGLRGFLALSVFFHHAAIYHGYIASNAWYLPSSGRYALLGQAGVSIFFMITGYLFWSQILKVKGKADWIKLYVGRAFRILPLYWFAVVLVLIGVGVHTHWRIETSRFSVLKEVARWSAGGVFPEEPINGDQAAPHFMAGVTWTLQYEWMFYASLLITAFAARRRLAGPLAPLIGLGFMAAYVWMFLKPTEGPPPAICAILFLIGMSVASFRSAFPKATLPDGVASSATLVALALILLVFRGAYILPAALALGGVFLLIASGATIFGLLVSRPAKRLGDISYGLYLLQGPVLALCFAPAAARAFALASPLGHWTLVTLAALLLIALATLTHVFIERPGIELGRRLLKRRPWLATSSKVPI